MVNTSDFWSPKGEVGAWVPAGVAYMAIGDEFARRLGCDPQEGRKNAAVEMFAGLAIGAIRAKADDSAFDLNEALAAEVRAFIEDHDRRCIPFNRDAVTVEAFAADHGEFPDQRKFSGPTPIPSAFWDFCRPGPYPINWAKSEFYWDRVAALGIVTGVEFAVCDLPCAEAVRAFISASGSLPDAAISQRGRKGGRPPSPAWPAFCAELVAYLAEHPDAGSDAGAVTRIADAVLDRLAEAGAAELAQTQARDAVRATLTRLARPGGS